MNWLILIVAGLLETGWAVGLKYTDSFTKFWPSVWTTVAFVASLVLLSIVMRTLSAGTAYAIWVGIGIIGTVIFGIAFLGESANMLRILGVALIVTGIFFLKLAN